ncbi:hypothetical protein B0H10DRAFT_1178492 [Mycena sp. CBHHK59/15]|nr:hypothetical protein B0H10DRAFT_1178492 [Mycena sp. CBHHK59/15]
MLERTETSPLTRDNRLFGGAGICGYFAVCIALSHTATSAQLAPHSHCAHNAKSPHLAGSFRTVRTRLDHLNDLDVYQALGKDFNFLKQHSLIYSIEDFMSKGTSRNMNTRVGEGFQQEVEKMYQKTTGKNAERQIGLQDEREDAMARVKIAIDE